MTANEFLSKHRNGADNIDSDDVINAFLSEMHGGLNGARSSLAMLPTYLYDCGGAARSEKYIVIDAGGTNFRSALGYYDGNKAVFEDERTVKMPASDARLSADEFYTAIARNIARLLPSARDIGFCFSYPVKSTADGDGVVIAMPKGIDAPKIIGSKAGERLATAISNIEFGAGGGRGKRKVTVLNDTAAALLGAPTDGGCARIGYIYGTGTNICVAADVHKTGGARMIFNTECGNFDKFPVGDFEKAAASVTPAPDEYVLEKATAGKYLASVIKEAFKAAEREGLISALCGERRFTLVELSDFLSGNGAALNGLFENDSDERIAAQIASGIIERAAKLGATVNAAAAVFCGDGRVEIVAEGSTFYKLCGYRDSFEKYLDSMLRARGISAKTVRGGGNLNGALAAVSRGAQAQSNG